MAEKNNRPKLPKTLTALQFLRTAKGVPESRIHEMMNSALQECKTEDIVLMLERIMLHIGDVNRQHNILNELGIKSPTGGAQEREIFRSLIRWWETNLPESFAKNIKAIVEFTVLENIMFYQNKTDRWTGKILTTEVVYPNRKVVFDYLAGEIRKGKNLNLIARHLPKHETGKYRTGRKVIKARTGVTEFNWTRPQNSSWVKLNGVLTTEPKIKVKNGDVVTYQRLKQQPTLNKQTFVNTWVGEFCKHMGWTINDYKEFRKKQNTPEQKFASKAVLDMAKSDFMSLLDKLTAGQRFRVAKTVCRKDGDKLIAREKWGKLGEYYIEWENNQEKVAEKLRVAASNNDSAAKDELMKEFKVKATGLQTIDILSEVIRGGLTNQQIDNTYQSMLEKMDLIANVFPIIDGSASMNSFLGDRGWGSQYFTVADKHKDLRLFDIAAAMAIAFSTRNPVQEFRNTFGWFSNDFKIIGKSKYVNEAPNQFVDSGQFTKKVNQYNILSETQTFTQNLDAIRKSNPGEVSSTNMFASIEYFVNLVTSGKIHVEDLPVALLYITDNENNSGRSPKDALQLAYSIGWHPLLIFWGLQLLPENLKREIKGLKNILLVGGFEESVLSQILRGIKSGSVDPEDELWSIFENKRYSVIS